MKKFLRKIDRCFKNDCPNWRYGTLYNQEVWYCAGTGAGRQLKPFDEGTGDGQNSEIPDWCPLPEWSEG